MVCLVCNQDADYSFSNFGTGAKVYRCSECMAELIRENDLNNAELMTMRVVE